MAPVYTCHRQLHPPTSVEGAVWGSVTSPGSSNLLVARRALLEIYDVVQTDQQSSDGAMLELVGGFPLAANIIHVAVVPLSSESTDLIAVTMEAAKFAILAFDSGLGQLVTLSIHNFEAGAIGPGSGALDEGFGIMGGRMNLPPTLTAVDPIGRCCAILVGGSQLVILPMLRHLPGDIYISKHGRDFLSASSVSAGKDMSVDFTSVQNTSFENEFQDSAGASGAAWVEGVGGARSSWGRWVALKPFSMDTEDAGVGGTVKCMTFLHGFNEPALALLHEPHRTWAGRLGCRRNTHRLTVLSLNLVQGRAPSIWRVAHIPHDATLVTAIPPPKGGAIVLCQNAVVKIEGGTAQMVVALNGYAAVSVSPVLLGCPVLPNEGDYGWASMTNEVEEGGREVFDLAGEAGPLELHSVCCAFITHDCALLSLHDGTLAILRLHTEGFMTVRTVGHCPPATTLTCRNFESNEGGLVFLGSRLGDSMLTRYDVYRTSAEVNVNEWKTLLRCKTEFDERVKEEEEIEEKVELFRPIKSENSNENRENEVPINTNGASVVLEYVKCEEEEEAKLLYGVLLKAKRARFVKSAPEEDMQESLRQVDCISFKFKALDSLQGLGPITSIQVGPVAVGTVNIPLPSTSNDDSSNGLSSVTEVPPPPICANAFICSTGYGKDGGIGLLWPGLRMDTSANLLFNGATGVWVVPCFHEKSTESVALEASSQVISTIGTSVLVSGNDFTRLFHAKEKESSGWVLSEAQSGEDESNNPFVTESRTICAGSILYGYTVQVHQQGIRVVGPNGDPAQDIMAYEPIEVGGAGVPEGCEIRQASIGERGFVLLFLDSGGLLLLMQEVLNEGGELVACNIPPCLAQEGSVSAASLFTSPGDLFAPPSSHGPYRSDFLSSAIDNAEEGYVSESEEWSQLYSTLPSSKIPNQASQKRKENAHQPFVKFSPTASRKWTDPSECAITYSCLVREVGRLEIWKISRGEEVGVSAVWERVFAAGGVGLGPWTLWPDPWNRYYPDDELYKYEDDFAPVSEMYIMTMNDRNAMNIDGFCQDQVSMSGNMHTERGPFQHTVPSDDINCLALELDPLNLSSQKEDFLKATDSPLFEPSDTMDFSNKNNAEMAIPAEQNLLDLNTDTNQTRIEKSQEDEKPSLEASLGGEVPLVSMDVDPVEGVPRADIAAVSGELEPPGRLNTLGDVGGDLVNNRDGEAEEPEIDWKDQTILDIVIQPVGATQAPASLQRLALVMRNLSGDLLVYEARFGAETDHVTCFIKVAHDFIARPTQIASEIGFQNASGCRTLCAFSDLAGHRGVAAFGAWSRPGLVLSERGAISVSPLAQHRRTGVASLACIPPGLLFPGGGLVEVTADNPPVLRLLSAAPLASQLLAMGLAGGGGVGGGGQGNFVAQRVMRVGGTVRRLVRLRPVVPASTQHRAGGVNLLAQLLAKPTYAAVVSHKVDILTEPPLEEGKNIEDMNEEAIGMDVEATKETLEDGETDNSIVYYKNFAYPDPLLGGAPPLYVDRFEIQVIVLNSAAGQEKAETVQVLPLKRDECVLCIEAVVLGPDSDRQAFVIVGTGVVGEQGEDTPPSGRLLAYELDYAHVALPDGGHRHLPKLKLAQEKEMSGPVGAAAQLSRYVATSAGASITIFEWDAKSGGLRPVGIYEASQYIVTMSVVKTFLLLGDIINSVQLLIWRDEDRSINQLAKDYEPTEVFATVFLVDQPTMCAVVGDSRGNIKLLRYAPHSLASRGGHRLVCDADFFLGAPAGAFAPQRLRNNKLNFPRFGAAIGGLDGSVALLAPLEERAFRRLYTLQGIMCNALEHSAATNPRESRLFRSSLPAAAAAEGGRMKGVLDGALLWRFVSLPLQKQAELTRSIGTTVEAVLMSLLDVDLQTVML